MRSKIIIGTVVLVVVITGIVLGLNYFGRQKDSLSKYRKEAVLKGDIQALVVTTGTLNPVTIVDVGSQVSGKIEKLYVDFNSRVKAGQIIAELDQELFQTRVSQNEANYKSALASLEKARVSLENSKKKYERALSLFDKSLISYEEMENSETQYYNAKAEMQSQEARLDQAQSQLESSRVDLAYTIIRSPIDGIVITRNINVGQTVAASFQAPVLFQIANDLNKMQVECSVDEADIGKVKEGQKVTFSVDAFPNQTFKGAVTQVRYSPEVQQNVVTYATIVEVENPELKLRPGMTATVSIVVGEAKGKLLVPNAALRFTPGPEEMRRIFEELRKERQSARGGENKTNGSGDSRPRNQQGESGRHFPGGMVGRMPGAHMQEISRVWVEDAAGKLRPLFIKTGVTDNSHTEVVSGDLKEGQEVITGTDGGSGSTQSTRARGRGMMFIRR